MADHPNLIAFEGDVRIAAGDFASVVLAARETQSKPHHAPVLIFNAATSETVELDLRGSRDDVLGRLKAQAVTPPPEPPRGPGRPKLGVVAREVTLLPRHWNWLNSQPGGASVALRKLVEHASRVSTGKDRIRAAQNVAYRFMSTMAGDRVGFEEASRALFAGDAIAFERRVAGWPKDIRDHLKALVAGALRVA